MSSRNPSEKDRARRLLRDTDPAVPDSGDDQLLGQLLIQNRQINADELAACVREQRRQCENGKNTRLGQILIQKGHITPQSLLEILSRRLKSLGVCSACGHIQELSENAPALCDQCGKDLEIQVSGRPRQGDGERIGKYLIRRRIGRGGMGVVFEAEDPDLGRRIALKVIEGDGSRHLATERLHREA